MVAQRRKKLIGRSARSIFADIRENEAMIILPYIRVDCRSCATFIVIVAHGYDEVWIPAFDELGNIYDAEGRLGMWWTSGDLAKYRAATAKLASQFDGYCPFTDLCVAPEAGSRAGDRHFACCGRALGARHFAARGSAIRTLP